jgi:protease I
MAQKKILCIIAFNGFHQTEYGVPKKILFNAGYDIVTASNKPGVAIAKDGSSVQINVVLESVTATDYKGILFIGGPGTLENIDTGESYMIAKEAFDANVPLGAICLATRILAHSGILKGKKATGWNGDHKLKEIFEEVGCEYIENEPVVIDGNIVTAVGPAAAEQFANAMLKLLETSK